jgi:hypothetical protein
MRWRALLHFAWFASHHFYIESEAGTRGVSEAKDAAREA